MKPSRMDINDLALRSSVVATALNLFDNRRLTYEEALILMIKSFDSKIQIMSKELEMLSAYKPASVPKVDSNG